MKMISGRLSSSKFSVVMGACEHPPTTGHVATNEFNYSFISSRSLALFFFSVSQPALIRFFQFAHNHFTIQLKFVLLLILLGCVRRLCHVVFYNFQF